MSFSVLVGAAHDYPEVAVGSTETASTMLEDERAGR
jgi:hypothetical protein